MDVKERDNRKHAAVIAVRLGQPDLREDAAHLLLDGSLGDPEAPAGAGIGAALGHQREHVSLARRELGAPTIDIPRRHELLNEGGIDHRAATTDPPHGVEELVEIGNATLEHVAGATEARKQRRRALDFDVWRESGSPHPGAPLGSPRSIETLRLVRWRHADVDYRNAQLSNEPHEPGSVARVTDDLVSAPLEQARNAFAQQHVVVRSDDWRATRILLHHREGIPQSNRSSPSQTCQQHEVSEYRLEKKYERSPQDRPDPSGI